MVSSLSTDHQLPFVAVKSAHADMDTLVNAEEKLIVDMAGVHQLDASDLGALTLLMKRQLETGGDLRLVNLSGQPLDMLRSLGCADLLTLTHDGVEPPRSISAAFKSFVTKAKTRRRLSGGRR